MSFLVSEFEIDLLLKNGKIVKLSICKNAASLLSNHKFVSQHDEAGNFILNFFSCKF